MHPNPIFRKPGTDRNIAFAHTRSFGVLMLNGPEGLLASHVPFVLAKDGARLEAHIVRSNPIWKAIETPRDALMIVSGPDGYISPDWYDIPDQVPTWNYVAVHLRGTLHRLDPSELAPHSARLSAQFEERLAPKPPWTDAKMTPQTLARLQRMIVPIELRISRIEGTWKLNQNKESKAIEGAIDGLSGSNIGAETDALADFMRQTLKG